MAIETEQLEGNRVLTYSTLGMKIERDGVRYDKAIDHADKCRVYTETDDPVDCNEVTEADKDTALSTLGVCMKDS